MLESTVTLADLQYALDQSAIVATTDVEGTITFCNDKFCEISKYSRTELLGQNHRILNSGLHPIEFFKAMYAVIAHGQVWRGEIRNRAKDGALYWVDTTIVPFLNKAGKPYQYMAIRYDITERKRAEAQIREHASLSRLGQMAAVVAHEVRNPLAGMRGALQVLEGRLPPDGRERGVIREVVARIDGLNDMVQELLEFARPRPTHAAQVSVGLLVREEVTLLSADPRLAGLSFDFDLADTTVPADRGQIRQVLLNLLINSAHAMGGRGRISIRAKQIGDQCELRVQDQGPGMADEVRARLFEPFLTTKSRGTGLGLATARRIVENHGGSLHLECPPDGGTLAIIRLPLAGALAAPRSSHA
jgi:PAS domain S-box-containing protein